MNYSPVCIGRPGFLYLNSFIILYGLEIHRQM